MTTIAINPPVRTKTKCGFDVSIFEIDTDDLQSGISGIIFGTAIGDIPKSWSDGGICSNAPDECNIDPHSDEIKAVIAKLQAARSTKQP